jgi:hypothetical protein
MSEPTAFEVQFKSKDGASHKPEIADKLAHETLHRCDEKELQEKQDKASERRKSLEKVVVDRVHADVEKAKHLAAQKHHPQDIQS